MIPAEWVVAASRRIDRQLYDTPITFDHDLNLYFKWENLQVTGSFKIRGALNKVLSLSPEERARGLVTCSAGNHGQGVAVAARQTASRCVVYASDHAVPIKLAAMKELGAEVRLVQGGYVEAEKTAISHAVETGMNFISPYNDPQVVAGQGTLGIEILNWMRTSEEVKGLLIPVGGGGLISGVGSYIRNFDKKIKIIGVQSEASPFAYQLFYTGSQESVVEVDTIAEGLAGEIDHTSITIPLMQECLDDIVLVTENEIVEAVRYAWLTHQQVIEGSAAVGLAARLAGKIKLSPVLTIITGRNIQPELFNTIIRRN